MTDLVFDANQQEKRFCSSRVPRSEVVYFTQIFIIVFLITVSLIMLLFFNWIVRSQHFGFRSSLAQLVTDFQAQSYQRNCFNKRSTFYGNVCSILLWPNRIHFQNGIT